MKLTTRGTVTRVFDKRAGVSKAGKAWASQDYGFVEDGTEDLVVFNIFGDEIISNVALKEGDSINATFDIRSREFNGRFYTEVRFVECEKMNVVGSDAVPHKDMGQTPKANDIDWL